MKISLLILFLLSCVAIYAMEHDFDTESDDPMSEISEHDIIDTESLDEQEDIDLDDLMHDNNDMEE